MNYLNNEYCMRKFTVILVLSICVWGGYASMRSENGPGANSSQNKSKKSEIVLCTWNLAHYFAYGTWKSVIDGPIYDSKLKSFREIVYDSIHADLISLNEYSSLFGIDKDSVKHMSSEVLFDGYNSWIEGGATKKGVGHNAIYSNVRMGNFQKHIFEYNKTTKYVSSHDYYYISADMFVGGQLVKFVCVYLIYATKDTSLVQNQIAELIEKYKDEKRVVMCGDFNTTDYSKLKIAGYSLANNGSFKTYYKEKWALDNIVAKGVKISDVRIVKTELSDHYPLICHISIK